MYDWNSDDSSVFLKNRKNFNYKCLEQVHKKNKKQNKKTPKTLGAVLFLLAAADALSSLGIIEKRILALRKKTLFGHEANGEQLQS